MSTDTPCVTCGYNLRTLALDGACPECATPVWDSLHGFYLHYASPAWVRGLARGLLLTLCAFGGMIFITPVIMLITGIWGFVIDPQTFLSAPTSAVQSNALLQALMQGLCTGLAMLGLCWLGRPDPRGRESVGVGRARHVLRWSTWLLPLPVVGNVALTWTLPALPPLTPGAPPPPGFPGQSLATVTALGFLIGLGGIVIYGVTLLALLRRIAHLVLRIPQPKLARAARISFWGLLASSGLMVVAYGMMFLLMMPAMSTLLATAGTTTTAAATATTTSVPVGPPGPSVTVTEDDTATESPDASATRRVASYRYTVLPSTMPASGPTSVPATLPAMGRSFFTGAILGGCGGALGGCGNVVFGIVVVVILIRTCSALFAAARAAEALAPNPSRAA